jgi:lipooligosaccharide transport system permease protein
LLSGVFFPLEEMPLIIQQSAQFFPLTHAVALVRPLITGSALNQVLLHLLVLSGYTLLALSLAITLLRRRLMA